MKSINCIPRTIFLTLLTIILTMNLYGLYANANYSIGLYVNNKPILMDVPPVLRNGRTLVPLSAIGNELNCKLTWNESTKSIIIRKNSSIIRLSIDNKLAYVDENPMHLDYPPIIINSRTMVPISFVAKALNCDIKWDPVLMNVYVQSDIKSMSIANDYMKTQNITVIDRTTIEMDIDGQTKIIKINGISCSKDENLLYGSGISVVNVIESPETRKIQEILESGNISMKVIDNIDNKTLCADIYIDGTLLSQILIELGYVDKIE